MNTQFLLLILFYLVFIYIIVGEANYCKVNKEKMDV